MDAEKLPGRAYYYFDRFVLDLHRGALLALDGAELPLRPKSFALLQLLLENAGKLLNRDTIMEAVWPDVFVTDDSITQCVGDIRRALGDEAQRLVRTVPRRGYLLTAEVSRIEPIRESPREAPQASAGQPAVPAPPFAGTQPDTSITIGTDSTQAERRQLTVMFVDLVGSTALTSRLDPEEMREGIRAYQSTVTGEILRYEGYIARFMGDGVLVYFGWPKAHEDEAERAVRAGLAIASAVPKIPCPATGARQQARVGIATGLVVVGDLIRSAEAQERSAVGESVNLAARLQGLAEPGGVVIAETTRRLLGERFDFAYLGACALEGFAKPVNAFAVIGECFGVESRFDAHQSSAPLPMVGRDQELALLLDRWHQAAAGEGQCVLLVSEAGIGKSRLALALQDTLSGQTHTIVRYQCSPYYIDSPLWPITQQLGHAAGFAADDDAKRKLAKLEALLRQAKDDIADAVTPLANLLDLDTSTRHGRPLDLTPEQQRARTLEILVEQLLGLARSRPVLMLLEDAHWIDPTTLELIELALNRIANAPVLMIITARPTFQSSLGGYSHVTRLTLNRLGAQVARTIVNLIAGGLAVPDEVTEELLAKSDGVPLFLEELTRTVLLSGVLNRTETAHGTDRPLPALAIPASLYDSLMVRLDQLRPVREVAQVAACIGREFSYELLAAVSPLPETDLRNALDQLAATELVFRNGSPPAARYTFKHALVRDAAYQSLLRSRRAQLHKQIAEALLYTSTDIAETHPELLAWHYAEAGLIEKAMEHWRRAGDRSAARFANREAIGHFRRAFELLEMLPCDNRRALLEAELRLAQVVPLIAVEGFGSQAVEECASRANALAENLQDWPGRFAARRVVWNSCLMRQPVPQTVERARELLGLADRDGSPAELSIACRALGYSLFIAGEQAEANQLLERGSVLADNVADSEFALYGEHPQIVCRLYRGSVRCLLGFPETGVHVAEEGLARARASNNPHTIAWSLVCVGDVHVFRRDATNANRFGAEAIVIAREHRLPQWLASAERIQGWALCQLGSTDEGLALLEDSLRRLNASGAVLHTSRIHCLLVEGYRLTGDLNAAQAHLATANEHSKKYGERYLAAELYRHEAALLRTGEAPARDVESLLRAAMVVARQQAARLLELRAAIDLAELWAESGERGKARDLLAPLRGSFGEGFALPDLIEAQKLLDAGATHEGIRTYL